MDHCNTCGAACDVNRMPSPLSLFRFAFFFSPSPSLSVCPFLPVGRFGTAAPATEGAFLAPRHLADACRVRLVCPPSSRVKRASVSGVCGHARQGDGSDAFERFLCGSLCARARGRCTARSCTSNKTQCVLASSRCTRARLHTKCARCQHAFRALTRSSFSRR